MNPNFSRVMETEDDGSIKTLKRNLKLMYLKDLELMKSQRKSHCWPSISSITSTPSPEPSENSSRPNSALPSEILTYSHNMRNVVKYLNDHVNVHGPMCTSSVKNSETNEPKISDFESVIMPPPSTTRVQRNKVSMNTLHSTLSAEKQKPQDVQHISESDIFASLEHEKTISEGSNKNIRTFSKWTVMINKDGKLVVKGKSEGDVTVRSKPISKKLSFTKLESINKHVYILEGNLFDIKNELPPYVRKKFINGFPDDWQNVVALWKQYLDAKCKLNFRWPTPASDSDHDDRTSDCSSDGHSTSITSNDSIQHNSIKEYDKLEAIELSCDSRYPANGAIKLMGKEKLVAFTQMLANKNVSREYVDRFREMLISMNSFVSLQECQNLLNTVTTSVTKPSWDNSISILNELSMSTPKKVTNPAKMQVEETATKGGRRFDNDDNECFLGVPKIPTNIFQNRKTIHRYPRRSRQQKRKIEPEVENCNFDDDVSIVTEYKAIMTKNQQKNKILKDDNSIEKDSGCHTMSYKIKKRRYSDDYDGLTSDMVDAKMGIPRCKADSKPSIVTVKNVKVNIKRLQKPDETNQMKNVVSKTEEKGQGNEKKEEAAAKRKSVLANEEKEHENKENEIAVEKRKSEVKNEERELRYKTNENSVEKKKYGMQNADHGAAIEERKHYGSIDNPKVLKSWKPTLVYDQRLENKCGIVLAGTLMNEARYVNSRKYQTDPLLRRISPQLVETIKNEYFKLEDTISDLKNVPKSLHSNLQNGLPSDLDDFCKKWKMIEDGNGSDNLDSTMTRRKRQSSSCYFWKAITDEEVQKSSQDAKVAKKLFPDEDNKPDNCKPNQKYQKKREENIKAGQTKKRGRPRKFPRCIYKKVSNEGDYGVELSEDYPSM